MCLTRLLSFYKTPSKKSRVRNLKFATYLKFAASKNTNKINELNCDLLNV